MSEKFQNKYRIKTVRLQDWDYGSDAAYFVTICTAGRKCYFGDVVGGKMKLTPIGQLAYKFWEDIPQHFPFVVLDAFVIMPNHMHGILIINNAVHTPNLGVSIENDRIHESNVHTPNLGVPADQIRESDLDTPRLGVSTNPHNPNPPKTPPRTAAASKKWKPATLGVIVNQYKRIVTIRSRKIQRDFGWQSQYYEHIIRDPASYERIKNYIVQNPANWEGDGFGV